VSLRLTAGQTIIIIVDGFGSGNGNSIYTSVVAAVRKTILPRAPFSGSVARGTGKQREQRLLRCGGSDSAVDVTYKWTAPVADTYVIDTTGSDYDTLLEVREGACSGTCWRATTTAKATTPRASRSICWRGNHRDCRRRLRRSIR